MKPRRVVITGLGALTPLGNTLPAYWEGLLSGISVLHRSLIFIPQNSKPNLLVRC